MDEDTQLQSLTYAHTLVSTPMHLYMQCCKRPDGDRLSGLDPHSYPDNDTFASCSVLSFS